MESERGEGDQGDPNERGGIDGEDPSLPGSDELGSIVARGRRLSESSQTGRPQHHRAPSFFPVPELSGLSDINDTAAALSDDKKWQSELGGERPIRPRTLSFAPDDDLAKAADEEAMNTTTTSKHDRKISWGHERKASWAEVDANQSHRRRLSSTSIRLSTLKQVNPLEQEAETHIISSLEDMEAKEHARGANEKPDILEFIPKDAEGVVLDALQHKKSLDDAEQKKADVTDKAEQHKPESAPPRPSHKRTKTVEQHLLSLTTKLEALHKADEQLVDVDADVGGGVEAPVVERINKPQAIGSADLLAENAAMLFRRKNAAPAQAPVKPGKDETVKRDQVEGELGSNQSAAIPFGSDDKIPQGQMAGGPSTQALLGHRKKNDDDNTRISESDLSTPDPRASTDLEGSFSSNPDPNDDPRSGDFKRRCRSCVTCCRTPVAILGDFVKEQMPNFATSFCLMIPLIGIACILFYLTGNPPTGILSSEHSVNGTLINRAGETIDFGQPSHSWWLLFAARQLLTFSLAKASEGIIIDIFCLRLRWINVFRSPLVTLLLVQSRGWPFLAVQWALLDLILLHGSNAFARHWMFYQNNILVFNESNPSGHVPSAKFYTQVLLLVLFIGLATAVKRVVVGFLQGKRVFSIYGDEVAALMRKVLLVSQVGALARDIESKAMRISHHNHSHKNLKKKRETEQLVSTWDDADQSGMTNDRLTDTEDSERFSSSQKLQIMELLGEFEDPSLSSGDGRIEIEHDISVSSILQFRQSLTFFDVRDSFGFSFGPTDTREHCVSSSEKVYDRLLRGSYQTSTISFDTIATLALHSDGTLKQKKVKELIHIFRPDRDGSLSKIDFVKSVDEVYKKMKLLRASIKKTQRLDQAVEKIFNVVFYVVVGAVALAVVGIDPMSLFLSLSSIIVAFAFMIGSASAKYFEGLLFILVRKPYDVGDRVFFNAPDDACDENGSPGWLVRDITLYHTTLVYGKSNEYCTVSNGSLANLRVINGQRSPKAVLFVYLKFGTQTPYSSIKVFENSLRSFVKSRPRQWIGVNGFRTTRVESDLGFSEVVVVLQHRESWQNVGQLLVSKAEITAFCHELQKKMDMRYKSPPLPVDLTVVKCAKTDGDDGHSSVMAKFEGFSTEGISIASTTGERAFSPTDFEAVAKLFGK